MAPVTETEQLTRRIAGTHISFGWVMAGVVGVWPLALFFAGVSALASAPMRDGIEPASFIGLAGAGLLLLIAGALLPERRDVH